MIVNLHAQLNMLGGLLVMLVGLTLALLAQLGGARVLRAERVALAGVAAGSGDATTPSGSRPRAVEAHDVSHGGATFHDAVARLEPWAALAARSGGARGADRLRRLRCQRLADDGAPAACRSRRRSRAAPVEFTGRIPRRVRGRKPSALAGYELPMALMGFPGLGWLFAGFPVTASILLLGGPAFDLGRRAARVHARTGRAR